ncbi:helix-turn-helix domain-containing protein [Flavobacterium sp. NST-5]|uniref:Helix-turn-helix domain-containing protein n=1 Tax=Flavobacterium ichthyis TaxID=2698827 RepID=A0ABW9ZE73_9FLAO|nr:helix-turn-helix domain-containing protein [Flavobacterium ichthyis]NBL65592.1 helix-turn-helix domain-containing protein [Flavobacterium ichthyis]
MNQVMFLVPEGLKNWSSITAISEIIIWADDHWKNNGNRSQINLQIARRANLFRAEFLPQIHIDRIEKADLIIIPSLSQQYDEVLHNQPHLIEWLKKQYSKGAEIASVCTGAFILAATGLVNGKECATHWDAADQLRIKFPKVKVSMDVLTKANGIYTNAGGYSFLNLALFLVEKFFDRKTAILCSKMFQIDIGRRSQSSFAIFNTQKQHGDAIVLKAQNFLEENVRDKITFEELSKNLAMSRRNFDRRFVKATGNTPLEYVQKLRIELAKVDLEETDKSPLQVMLDCGYTDEKSFRELFKRFVGVSPVDYRAQYHINAVIV